MPYCWKAWVQTLITFASNRAPYTIYTRWAIFILLNSSPHTLRLTKNREIKFRSKIILTYEKICQLRLNITSKTSLKWIENTWAKFELVSKQSNSDFYRYRLALHHWTTFIITTPNIAFIEEPTLCHEAIIMFLKFCSHSFNKIKSNR